MFVKLLFGPNRKTSLNLLVNKNKGRDEKCSKMDANSIDSINQLWQASTVNQVKKCSLVDLH